VQVIVSLKDGEVFHGPVFMKEQQILPYLGQMMYGKKLQTKSKHCFKVLITLCIKMEIKSKTDQTPQIPSDHFNHVFQKIYSKNVPYGGKNFPI